MPEAAIIDGKAYAQNLRAEIGRRVAALKARDGTTPGLAVVLVGDDPASQVYVRNKNKMTLEAGMNSWEYKLPVTASHDEVMARVAALNADAEVDGILVQLPLSDHIDAVHHGPRDEREGRTEEQGRRQKGDAADAEHQTKGPAPASESTHGSCDGGNPGEHGRVDDETHEDAERNANLYQAENRERIVCPVRSRCQQRAPSTDSE